MDEVHESDSESGGFPLSVDLSSYVGTPAHCRVWVRTRARKVRWLANRVRRAARLRGPLLLKAGECLLPPGEPLKVIRSDDTLSVARVEHNWQRPFSFHDEDEDVPKESATAVESNSPAKLLTLEPSSLEKPQPANQKHIRELVTEEPSIKPALKRQHQSLTEGTEQPVLVDHEALLSVKQRALALLQKITGEQDVVDAPKKKRRRVRRRRPCKDVKSVEAVESESMQNVSELQIPSNQDETLEDPPSDAVQNGTLQPQVHSSALTPSPAVPLCMTSVSAVPSPAVSMASFSAVPCPTVLTYPPESVLVRNPTPPRAPRLIRALSTEPTLEMDALVS